MQKAAFLLLTLPLSSLVACGDPAPSPSLVRTLITDDLGHVLRESSVAGERGSAALQAQSALGLINRFSGTTQAAVLGKRLTGTLAPGLNRVQATSTAAPSGASDTDQLIELLTTKVFTDENEVSDGIYKIPGSLVCETDSGVDAECVQQFDKLEARLHVTYEYGSLDVTLQLDSDHDEPLHFALSPRSLVTTIDLDETGQAIRKLAPVFGEAAPNASLAGALTGRIDVLGPQSATFSLTIDRKIDVKFAEAGVSLDGADAFRFSSASLSSELLFDAVAGSGSLFVELGATAVHVPSLEDPSTSNDPRGIDLDLPGASIVAMLAANQPAQLTHIGLGDRTTTVSVGGQRAIAIDLNPDDGRALSATLAQDGTISVTPKLDLRTAVDHAVLGDTAPVYDVTQVLMTGSLRGADAAQIQVISGTFGIATNPADFGFSATAGQCVTATEAEDVTSGRLYEQFAVGSCN